MIKSNHFHFNFRNPLILQKEENSENQLAKNENLKQYEDYIERTIIIEKDNYTQDKDNYVTYFLKQMTYPLKVVR